MLRISWNIVLISSIKVPFAIFSFVGGHSISKFYLASFVAKLIGGRSQKLVIIVLDKRDVQKFEALIPWIDVSIDNLLDLNYVRTKLLSFLWLSEVANDDLNIRFSEFRHFRFFRFLNLWLGFRIFDFFSTLFHSSGFECFSIRFDSQKFQKVALESMKNGIEVTKGGEEVFCWFSGSRFANIQSATSQCVFILQVYWGASHG